MRLTDIVFAICRVAEAAEDDGGLEGNESANGGHVEGSKGWRGGVGRGWPDYEAAGVEVFEIEVGSVEVGVKRRFFAEAVGAAVAVDEVVRLAYFLCMCGSEGSVDSNDDRRVPRGHGPSGL